MDEDDTVLAALPLKIPVHNATIRSREADYAASSGVGIEKNKAADERDLNETHDSHITSQPSGGLIGSNSTSSRLEVLRPETTRRGAGNCHTSLGRRQRVRIARTRPSRILLAVQSEHMGQALSSLADCVDKADAVSLYSRIIIVGKRIK